MKKNWLPNDVCRCVSGDCPVASRCLRSVANVPERGVYSDFYSYPAFVEKCPFYIPAED